MAHLISYKPSFEWEDTLIDRGDSINMLNSALVKATEYKDTIFKTPNFQQINLTWGNLFEFIYSYGYDEQARIQRFPWMTQIQHTSLIYLLNYFKNTTPLRAQDLGSLISEFPGSNCGWVGFHIATQIDSYVSCSDSLNLLHRRFVTQMDYNQRCQNRVYFKKFFVPQLTKNINQINSEIDLGHYPAIIERIDVGKIIGEKLHVHFSGKHACALNIDGTWKHKNPKFKIPVEVCRLLSNWGFMLPDEYY